jgi:hypothetical protein
MDWLIPIAASPARSILKSWLPHYNSARPHMALGLGVPHPSPASFEFGQARSRHRHHDSSTVCVKSVLGELHHEYHFAPADA